MIRFSIRLLLAGGRRAALAAGLVGAGVAMGTLLLAVTLGALHGWDAREARTGWRVDVDSAVARSAVAEPVGTARVRVDSVAGRPMDVVDLSATGSTAPPPGLPRVPAPGEVWVSPALAELIRTLPPAQLADRFPGPPTGTIDDTGLRDPGELVAIVGHADPVEGAVPIAEFDRSAGITIIEGYRQLTYVAVALLLFPVLGLLGAAARLTAVRRAERLATLRLLGASTRQLTVVAVTEVTLVAAVAAVAGIVAEWLLAPALALIPLGGSGWYASDLRVPPLVALAVVAGVALLAAAAATRGMRAVVVGPLGVVRRQAPRGLRWWHLLGVVAALIVFGIAQAAVGTSGFTVVGLVIAVAVLAMFGVVWLVGPWVVRLVGARLARSARSVPRLLAGRRMLDDPRGAFRPLAGLTLAVFVAGFLAPFSGALGGDPEESAALRVGESVSVEQVQARLQERGLAATVTASRRGPLVEPAPGTNRDEVRTALVPLAGEPVVSSAERDVASAVLAADIYRGILIVLVATFLVAATSAGTTAAARVLDQRRTLRLLNLAGTPMQVLAAAQRVETVRPLLVCGGIALVAGLVCAAPIMSAQAVLEPAGLTVLGSVVVIGALLVVAASAASRPLLRSVAQDRVAD
ncbi:FtsX-like permease family protein [Pseudonocardia thermophila]|uniref:FtsX-like permease family protein n=1 Tax=Pseudonocardia thermophila TaxID=1848 RepID=A0A1M6RQM4_PSETH|nr:FtsX-like permease family protein [Pseudonocardia thermophila]SHK34710.1 FtsX-like permease family protein [Pseudonocardia thermophila]